ncbi:uncharacterized protein LOC123429713 [Hordeum vulgare subsp. vulgare]|uniref:uncharacterized protein LOC123429713 n=1 Tax=Hordeum vulgare subsp. vulgare TaxID=112509 RepID=UPI001D1A3E22|nr:uncharacterized protein LOC123429713 [Hordeum vulgare subsp. vulgare]KAI5007839.1 hypothetical protein ZWY2020_008887 [Hordeum vulgare]
MRLEAAGARGHSRVQPYISHPSRWLAASSWSYVGFIEQTRLHTTHTRETGKRSIQIQVELVGSEMVFNVVAAAVIVGLGAVGAYFLWPAAVVAGGMMKAPGAAGFLISRAAFAANPQMYFQLLHNAGAAAAFAA